MLRRLCSALSGAKLTKRLSGELEQSVGISDDTREEALPGGLVLPVDLGLAFETLARVAEVARKVVLSRPLLRPETCELGEGPHEQDDAIGEQVVGVLDRTPSENVQVSSATLIFLLLR